MFSFRKKTDQAKRKLSTEPPRKIIWRKSYSLLLLLIPLLGSGYYLRQMDQLFPIKTIQLSGNFENIDQQQLESSLQQYLGEGFFSLDIHQLRQQLYQQSWADSVSVRRVWPDRLMIRVVEKRPLARWDEQHLLSDKAVVYKADVGEFHYLPKIHAHNHQPAWILQRYYQLKSRFDSVDEQIAALEVDSRGALDVELINGLQVKLGRSEIDRKIERLIAIYPLQILPRRAQIQRLDLRYSNGFAVAWKKEVLQGRDKASIWSNSNV